MKNIVFSAPVKFMLLLGILFLSFHPAIPGQTPSLITQRPHSKKISYVFFNKTGNLIYSVCNEEKLAKVWDVQSGKLVKDINLSSSYESYFYMPSHGGSLISFMDSMAIIYDLEGRILKTQKIGGDYVAETDPKTGNMVFNYINPNTVKFLDTKTGSLKEIFSAPAASYSLHFNMNGSLTITNDSVIYFVDLTTGSTFDSVRVRTHSYFDKPAGFVDSARQRELIYENQLISIVSIPKKDTIVSFSAGDIELAAVSPDFHYGVIKKVDSLYILDIQQQKIIRGESTGKNSPFAINFITNSIIDVNFIFNHALFNIESDKTLISYSGFNDIVHLYNNSIYFKILRQTKQLVLLRQDSIYFRSLDDGHIERSFKLQLNGNQVSSLDIDPDHKTLIVAGVDGNQNGSIQVYDLAGNYLSTISGVTTDLYTTTTDLYFDSAGRLISYGPNNNAKSWNLSNGDIHIFDATNDILQSNKDFLVSQSTDTAGNIQFNLVNAKTGQLLQKRSTTIPEMFFFQNGSALFLGDAKNTILLKPSYDSSLLVWETSTNSLNQIPFRGRGLGGGQWEDFGELVALHDQNYLLDSIDIYEKKTLLTGRKPRPVGGRFLLPVPGTNKFSRIMESDFDKPVYIDIFDFAGQSSKTILKRSGTNIYKTLWDTQGKYFAIGYLDGIIVFEYRNHALNTIYVDTTHFAEVPVLAFDSGSTELYFANRQKELVVLDLISKTTRPADFLLFNQPLQLALDKTNRLAILEDGNMIQVLSKKPLSLQYTILDIDSRSWQIVLPAGYYYASSNTSKNIGFSIWPNFYPFEQFDLQFNRPDTVLYVLGVKDRKRLDFFHDAWQKRLALNGFHTDLRYQPDDIPSVTIPGKPAIPSKTKDDSVQFFVNLLSKKSRLKYYSVYDNNVPILKKDLGIDHLDKEKVIVKLTAGPNKIQVSARNENGLESLKETVYINFNPDSGNIRPGKTYFIGIGVAKYPDRSNKLDFASKDVEDLNRLFQNHDPNVQSFLFEDEKAVKDSILSLRTILANTNIEDRVILLFSGHGLTSGTNFYFATYDCNFSAPESKGLSFEAIGSLLKDIPARKKLIFMDACNSGLQDTTSGRTEDPMDAAFSAKKSFGNLAAKNSFELMQDLFSDVSYSDGSVIITAARGTEYANEDFGLQNGVLSHCIIEGLSKKMADADGNGQITISELKDYILTRVPAVTKSHQQPTARKDNIDNSWIIWQ